jgi:hypothetical protein
MVFQKKKGFMEDLAEQQTSAGSEVSSIVESHLAVGKDRDKI